MTSLSPATTGEDSPGGAGTFHFTFLSGPISTGGFWSSATPEPLGPRNCGHAAGWSAARAAAANTASAADAFTPSVSSPSMVAGRRPPRGWIGQRLLVTRRGPAAHPQPLLPHAAPPAGPARNRRARA